MHRKTLCMIIFSLKDTRQHWYKNTRQQEFQQNPFHTVNLLESQDVEEPGVTPYRKPSRIPRRRGAWRDSSRCLPPGPEGSPCRTLPQFPDLSWRPSWSRTAIPASTGKRRANGPYRLPGKEMTCQRSVSIAWEGDDSEKKDMIGSKQHMATNKRPGHLLSEGRQVISFPSGNKTECWYDNDKKTRGVYTKELDGAKELPDKFARRVKIPVEPPPRNYARGGSKFRES